MPVPVQVAGALMSVPLAGAAYPLLAQGVAQGLCLWASTGATLIGVATGLSGVGTVLAGTFLLPPQPEFLLAGCASAGVQGAALGETLTSLATGISVAVTSLFRYAGPVPGCGSGVDATRIVVPTPAPLVSSLLIGLNGAGINGVAAALFAQGLGQGLAAWFSSSAFGTAPVIGSPSVPTVSVAVPTALRFL